MYQNACDLRVIQDSLAQAGAFVLPTVLFKLILAGSNFGFHLVEMEFRQLFGAQRALTNEAHPSTAESHKLDAMT